MSKHCDVCNRSYPDELDACPHCAGVAEVSEADVVELAEDAPEVAAEGAQPVGASDSAVDLGTPVVPAEGGSASSPSGSGISVVEWASLVEESPAPAEPAAATFDDPADADVIARAGQSAPASPAAPPPAPPAAGEGEDALAADLESVRTIFAGDASASFARRGPAQPAAEPPAEDDSALDLLAPDAGREAPAAAEGSDPDINLGVGPLEAESGSHKTMKPGAPGAARPPEGGSDPDINLGAPGLEGESASRRTMTPGDVRDEAQSALAEGESQINLGEAPREADSGSDKGIEPEALEAVDSGIDLASAELEEQKVADAAAPAPAAADAGEPPHDDSAVDLGAPAVMEEPEVEELSEIQVVDSGIDLSGAEVLDASPPAEKAVRPISDSGIDLSGGDASGTDSGPQAGIEKSTPGTSDSGRDLIAEEVESGMNLPRETFATPSDSGIGSGVDVVEELIADESGTALTAGQLPSSEEEVDLTEMPAEVVESSAVDLGASAQFPAAPAESAASADVGTLKPHDDRPSSIHGEEEASPSEVDLGGRRTRDLLASAAPEQSAVDIQDELESAEATTAAEEEEAAAAPKERRRPAVGAWVGGAALGSVVTAGVGLLLWWLGALPAGTTNPGTPATQGTQNAQGPQAAPPLTLADKLDLMRSGSLDKVRKAVENTDESKPDELALRGQYRVRDYLNQRVAGKDDKDALQKGLDDLEKSKDKNPDALFWLGVAKEATKDYAGAQKVYQEGTDRFKDDPAVRQRFEAGLNRVSLKLGQKPAGTSRAEPALDPALVALALTGLEPIQQPPQPPPQPPAAEEAGSAFWQAEKLAREGKYGDAVKALDKAAELHDKRRFAVLGQAQNPNSDPTEEIFLRSCEELKAYWQLQDKLHSSTLPFVKGKDPAAAVDALLADDKDLADKLAQAQADAANAGNAKKDVETAKKEAEAAKKEAEAAKKDLETTKKALEAANAGVEAAKKDVAAAQKKADDLADKVKLAEDDAAKKGEALKGVAAALTPKFLKPDAGDAAVLPAVKEAARLAAASDPQGQLHALQTEMDGLKAALQQRWDPEQMLTIWMPLLREHGRKDLAEKAVADADRVLKDDKASPADKAHAHAVKGLALRNEEKYAEAKPELEKAKADLPKGDGEWALETEAALKEIADPSAYFVARAEAFRKEGRTAQAITMLDKALPTAAAAAKPKLLIESGTLHLDEALARAKGQVAANDPDAAAARKNADEAKKDGGAEAFYLSGRVAEALGQYDAAADEYRQALKAHGDLDADGVRYRAALARMLVLPKAARPDVNKVGMGDLPRGLDLLAALVAVTLQPGELPGRMDASTQEAQRLADEILSAKGDVPFEARAQAYAVKGRWTEALTTYVEGLRPSLSPEHAAGLMAIIQGHPLLRQPTLMTVADPLGAEKHYSAGLQFYNDRQYDKAEKEFFTAVEHDGQDARYYYYLGLSRLMQGDRDAYEDFEQGARLERQGRPPRAAVSAALERVQGAPRERLNDIRDRPR